MSNWGGKRERAGSGGKRDGAGRPRTRWNAGAPGTAWIFERSPIGDVPRETVLIRVLSVSTDAIEFQVDGTEEIIVIYRETEENEE